MHSISENNKRIAKNTLFLYVRMLLIMGVTLYTSRVVLQMLGVEDYGIYNVVGGIVVLFTFVNNAMVTSTQRFLNYELGRGDLDDNPTRVLCQCHDPSRNSVADVRTCGDCWVVVFGTLHPISCG